MFRGSFFEGVPKFHIILSHLGGVLRYLVKRTHCMTVIYLLLQIKYGANVM